MNKPNLYWPLPKPVIITQRFGVNGEYYRKNGIGIAGHNGLDLLAAHGQAVRAAHDGWAYYEVDSKQGHGVVIRSDKEALMFGSPTFFKTGYWHLCDPKKEPNLRSPIPNDGKEYYVRTGDIIGYADNTGLSTGDHVHFFIKAIVKIGKKWVNSRQSNGYLGSSDPSFYMEDMTAEDYAKARDALKDAEEIVAEMPRMTSKEREKTGKTLVEMLKSLLTKLFGQTGYK